MSYGTDSERVSPAPLRVLIVGAGIGGLTAAVALRQQGHDVEIFERSKLSQETGAAIHLASNANGLLRRLGLFAEDIGAVECVGVQEFFPHNGSLKYNIRTKPISDKLWSHPWQLVHRAHLHTKLRQMALEKGKGTPAKLHLGQRVKEVDPASATIVLDDGTKVSGDVVIGADGVHSRTRASIPGGDLKPFGSGKSAYRFLVPTATLMADPRTKDVVRPSELVMWIAEDRRLIMYPCVNNELVNFVAIHPSRESAEDVQGEGWQETGSKARMLEIYKSFHSSVLAVIETADDPKVWELLDMEQMPAFVHQKLAILGDAAHPFLPHQGQGAGQAMEDALALAAVLPLGTLPADIPERLEIYEKCRYRRAHTVQDFTRTAGKDAAELAKEGKTLDMNEYQMYNFGHDAYDHATKALQDFLEAKDPTFRFRAPLGFGPSPGPRRPLGLQPSDALIQSIRKKTPELFTTYSIKFTSSRTHLQNMLPPGFSFGSPATKASASMSVTTLNGMAWLGGKGYSHCGLYLHGVQYRKRDGSTIFGTYLPLLFENLTDPIITGRDELGMPKIFADIDVQPTDNGATIALGAGGVQFARFQIQDLQKEALRENGVVHHEPAPRGPGPPPPPPEQGQFVYRYVPAVGEPGKVDVQYPVFIPKPEPSELEEVMVSKTATLTFDAKNWQTMPTLHHIARGLAEIPVYDIQEARLTRGVGVNDVASAHRIE